MKLHSTAANGLGTGAFQKCNWGQIGAMVDRGLNVLSGDINMMLLIKTTLQQLMFI